MINPLGLFTGLSPDLAGDIEACVVPGEEAVCPFGAEETKTVFSSWYSI